MNKISWNVYKKKKENKANDKTEHGPPTRREFFFVFFKADSHRPDDSNGVVNRRIKRLLVFIQKP